MYTLGKIDNNPGKIGAVSFDFLFKAGRAFWSRSTYGFVPAFLLAFGSAAYAEHEELCPKLPPQSGLVWNHYEGPDFDVCYAAPPGVQKIAFGIYMGGWPHFSERNSTAIGPGRVAGREVTWFGPTHEEDVESPLYRQALVKLDEQRMVAHVWVMADNPDEMKAWLAVLEHISFAP